LTYDVAHLIVVTLQQTFNAFVNMTRINVGIDPKRLSRQHLLAEHREIKRIPNAVARGRYNLEGIPDKFKLGKGHVKFFYNKLLYLHKRYKKIYKECKKRGYNVCNYDGCWANVPQELYNDWRPSGEDKALVEERIGDYLPWNTSASVAYYAEPSSDKYGSAKP